jgi:hypothetical protein
MTLIVTMWNGFANHDRKRVGAASPSAPISGSVTRDTSEACTTPLRAQKTGARCMTVTRTRSS